MREYRHTICQWAGGVQCSRLHRSAQIVLLLLRLLLLLLLKRKESDRNPTNSQEYVATWLRWCHSSGGCSWPRWHSCRCSLIQFLCCFASLLHRRHHQHFIIVTKRPTSQTMVVCVSYFGLGISSMFRFDQLLHGSVLFRQFCLAFFQPAQQNNLNSLFSLLVVVPS